LPYLAPFRRFLPLSGFIVIADAFAGVRRRARRHCPPQRAGRGDTGRFRLTDRRGSMVPGEGAITGPTSDGWGQR
jgi:hypothetical protein